MTRSERSDSLHFSLFTRKGFQGRLQGAASRRPDSPAAVLATFPEIWSMPLANWSVPREELGRSKLRAEMPCNVPWLALSATCIRISARLCLTLFHGMHQRDYWVFDAMIT